MKPLPPSAAALIEGLLNVLDREVELLELRCGQLSSLSRAALQRDDGVLQDLLEEIHLLRGQLFVAYGSGIGDQIGFIEYLFPPIRIELYHSISSI